MSGKEEDPQKCWGCAVKSAAGGGRALKGKRHRSVSQEHHQSQLHLQAGEVFFGVFLISIQAPSFPSPE